MKPSLRKAAIMHPSAAHPRASLLLFASVAAGVYATALAVVVGTPTRWLTLSEPMWAQGPYGFRRRVRALGIETDAAEEFDRSLAARAVERPAVDPNGS